MKLGLPFVLAHLTALGVALGAACSATRSSPFDDTSGAGGTPGSTGATGGANGLSQPETGLAITPADAVITVKSGAPVPGINYVALQNGAPTNAKWSIDRGEIGAVQAASGVFTPAGKVGGKATVTAMVGSVIATTSVTVKLAITQNGHDPTANTGSGGGFGGVGGVGGEGEGVAVSPETMAVLSGAPSASPGMTWLYPYDGTVWPKGLLAPLLQWTDGGKNVDAILIRLKGDDFDYAGYFGRPPSLPIGASFVRHPIPQAAWYSGTYSTGGTLSASITFASGGKAYGPIVETWKVAPGMLRGTVYYNSYGTKLAKNASGAIGGDGMFGGAVLAIKPGATDPQLAAGASGDVTACRTCHVVSADGSRMLAQHGEEYGYTSSYDLKNGYAESVPPSSYGKYGWGAIYPDGSMVLSNVYPYWNVNETISPSKLYGLSNGTAVPTTGFSDQVTNAATPVFSPDGKHIAFNFVSGSGNAAVGPGDATSLVAMDFDVATMAFGPLKPLMKAPSGHTPGWPSFLPTNDAVVFELETRQNTSGEFLASRWGARAELWWADLATGKAARLDALNGRTSGGSYLPTSLLNHDDDTTLNFEPTANPVASGGYAWVVFTTRRLYGNVATIDPWWSDPREHDLTSTPTPKKLWVAAIDLNAPPGSDPSHPAFYLPGQELLAANSRGYWVVDPCKPDGSTCAGGDECCGGYCRPTTDGGALSCQSTTNTCSGEFDKCSTSADCCDAGMQCIDGRCAIPVPK